MPLCAACVNVLDEISTGLDSAATYDICKTLGGYPHTLNHPQPISPSSSLSLPLPPSLSLSYPLFPSLFLSAAIYDICETLEGCTPSPPHLEPPSTETTRH